MQPAQITSPNRRVSVVVDVAIRTLPQSRGWSSRRSRGSRCSRGRRGSLVVIRSRSRIVDSVGAVVVAVVVIVVFPLSSVVVVVVARMRISRGT